MLKFKSINPKQIREVEKMVTLKIFIPMEIKTPTCPNCKVKMQIRRLMPKTKYLMGVLNDNLIYVEAMPISFVCPKCNMSVVKHRKV